MPWKFFTSGKEKVIDTEKNPSGMILQFAGSTIPLGWLACDGSQVAIASYPNLYKAIKTNYGTLTDGSGNTGTTHFRLPDLRGRIPVGRSAGAADGVFDEVGYAIWGTSRSGKGSPPSTFDASRTAVSGNLVMSVRDIGNWRGTESVTLTSSESGIRAHDHSISGGAHTHYLAVVYNLSSQGYHYHTFPTTDLNYRNGSDWAAGSARDQANGGYIYYNTSAEGPNAAVADGTSGVGIVSKSENADSPHSTIQQSLVVNFMIKT